MKTGSTTTQTPAVTARRILRTTKRRTVRALKWTGWFLRGVFLTVRALAAGLLRVWDALTVWFSGEDLADKGFRGVVLFRALRFRIKVSIAIAAAALTLFGLLWRKACTVLGLSFDQGFWMSFTLVIVPALAWVIYAGWDGSIANNTPTGAVKTRPPITGENILAACANVTRTKVDAWADRIIGPGVTWTSTKPRWWEITVAPPGSITPAQMKAHAPKIAAFLGLDETWLIIDKGPNATVIITGCEEDPWTSLDLRAPFAATGQPTDVFTSCPIARTSRGQLISIPLMWMGWLIAAVMRVGKTTAGRVIATFIALDPVADMAIFDFKGTGWGMFKRICLRYGAGPGKENIKALLEWGQWLEKEIARRADAMEGLGASTDGRISRAISARRELGLRPIFTMIDEAHIAFEDEEYGSQIADVFADVQKLGAAFGITVIVLTQLPQAESVPTKIRNAILGRIALKLMYPEDSRQALGAAAGRAGFDASEIPYEQGVTEGRAILVGVGPMPLWVRCLAMSAELAEALVQRAIEIRREAGVLPGQDAPPPDEVVLKLHELLVSRDGVVLSREAADHLASLELVAPPPGQTDDLALSRALAKHLKRWEITTGRDDARRAVYRLEDVEKVVNGHVMASE